jgi:primase-polymerase (primpol)-like protein
MPETFRGNFATLPAALAPLIGSDRWVVWRWTRSKGRWTKPPYRADSPAQFARTDDPTTWCSFQTATDTVAAGQADGIGFMLKGSGIAAIDLDHCRDAAAGTIDDWAADIVSRVPGAYTEVTASGCGLRVLGLGMGAELHRKFAIDGNGAAVEL